MKAFVDEERQLDWVEQVGHEPASNRLSRTGKIGESAPLDIGRRSGAKSYLVLTMKPVTQHYQHNDSGSNEF